MMNFLSKIPFVGTLLSKGRLILEYFLIAALIAIAAVVITLWYKNQKLEQANDNLGNRVAVVELTNSINESTIQELKEARKVDAEVISELAKTQQRISQKDEDTRKRLDELEKQSEDVKNYLDQPMPPELACMLFNTCPKTSYRDGSNEGAPSGLPTRVLLAAKRDVRNKADNTGHR